MKYYIIDYENLHESAFHYIENNEDNKLILVYSDNANKISIDLISKYKLDYCKTMVGNQAADMFIAYYIGSIISSLKEDDEIIILSKDKDFDGLVNTLKCKINISRSPSNKKANISPAISHNNLVVQSLTEAGLNNSETGKVAKQVAYYLKTNQSVKLSTYRYLIKVYGKPKGLKLYNCLKPIL